ncbi:MAG: glutamine-hydrolyzing GMP synthase [Ignavibacteria bacterium]|jgi:GMP synthase (glutamine-hydrolysing)|nr:glutamine-hydrolyzing GMP synthase [Ignavibacteria bacterium]MDH7527070.1 glutamine-hydrolyzing GMP synthase [Ignavibacteria bacterium]
MNVDKILIIDFGSQYTQLILRRVRENKVFAILKSNEISVSEILAENPKGIILSGGPSSVYDINAPQITPDILKLNIPILGICFGFQLISKLSGGIVERSEKREFGLAKINIKKRNQLFDGLPESFNVWMSHSDKVIQLPPNFITLASTINTEYAAACNPDQKVYGVQFHPEVFHTEFGNEIINNFLFKICNCKPNWQMKNFVQEKLKEIKEKANDNLVVCALSGGVDSTVAAVLVHKAIGNKLHCIHVDTGLMRKNESENIINFFTQNFKLNLHFIDASKIFLERLKGVIEPEEKRKIIGKTFIEIFENEIKKIGEVKFLVQGTLYPDVVESGAFSKHSSVIKTHHNVGGLPENLKFDLIEPLRELFKDEVRELGKELQIPEEFLKRHPFPGPGLAVRIIGEVNYENLQLLREADSIFIEELKKHNLYDRVWQAFAVLLPVKSVGVMGDERSYGNTIVLRAVTSIDGMTADWAKLDYDFLNLVSNRIINEIKGVNRVVYDITSKPPATIEWE